MHIPQLIQDLALMLLVAGIMTLIFKKLKQPLVLGYIVTGFLVGPNFSYFPAITDAVSIETWSEIGIIILMFALGLEFNLLKLFSVGKTAVITAITELAAMFFLGILVGNLMGLSSMESIFLGCMLSMSSTTIIIKAFEDLELKDQPFTESVFGTLIIEDIAGILMMVIFSTMAVSQGISGGELTMSLVKMGFYLILWLILGILIIPTFMKKVENLMSDETLTIVSIGICFGMVLLAHYLGFSSALGAFLAGSLLAGTSMSERIERVTKPNKDLFGAVFFISVGTMVDPAQVVSNAGTIAILTLVTVFGKALFSTLGVFLSGKPLKTAMQCGFSLAQIGEFSFIIASLGISLGLIDKGIYPIIVTVSVITTFTTPFVIKSESAVYGWLSKVLPDGIMSKLNREGKAEKKEKDAGGGMWGQFFKTYLSRLFVQVMIILGISLGGIYLLWPFLVNYINYKVAAIISTLLVIGLSSPFLKQTAVQRNRYYLSLWFKNQKSHFPLMLCALVSLALMISMIVYPMRIMLNLNGIPLVLSTFLIVFIITYSDGLMGVYQRIERLFFRNLGVKPSAVKSTTASRPFEITNEKSLPVDIMVAKFYFESPSPLPGKRLRELIERTGSGIKVICIGRGGRYVFMPNKNRRLVNGDEVYIAGQPQQLEAFFQNTQIEPDAEEFDGKTYVTLDEFLSDQTEIATRNRLSYRVLEVTPNSVFCGMNVHNSRFGNKHQDLLLLIQREGENIVNIPDDFKLVDGDKLWILGRPERGKPLKAPKNA